MILSEVEILKSARLARTVVLAEKLHENQAFLNPPVSPFAWFKARIRAVIGIFGSSPKGSGGPIEDRQNQSCRGDPAKRADS